jgi:hypothetical protein
MTEQQIRLIDHFAGLAMQSLLTEERIETWGQKNRHFEIGGKRVTGPEFLADWVYDIAEAMVAEASRRNSPGVPHHGKQSKPK